MCLTTSPLMTPHDPFPLRPPQVLDKHKTPVLMHVWIGVGAPPKQGGQGGGGGQGQGQGQEAIGSLQLKLPEATLDLIKSLFKDNKKEISRIIPIPPPRLPTPTLMDIRLGTNYLGT